MSEEKDIFTDIGKPKHFDVSIHIKAIDQLICADEIEFALKMMDMLPGFYRENVPLEIKQIKKELYRQIQDTIEYANDQDETYKNPYSGILSEKFNSMFFFPRAAETVNVILEYNKSSVIPHIIEFGPADYCLYDGLKSSGCDFSYQSLTINEKAKAFYPHEESDKGGPQIFICFETIEHLWNPDDIVHLFNKYCDLRRVEYVLLSTPLNTLNGGMGEWRNRPLGHLRTYTSREFLDWGRKSFPGFEWTLYIAPMQFLKGKCK